MSNVLKVQIAGQRYRYEVMQVVFDEDNDWLKDPKELTQGEQRDFLRFNDNRLDISDYEYFDHIDAGVAIVIMAIYITSWATQMARCLWRMCYLH